MRVLAPNKLELWPSIALMSIGVLAFRMSAPLRPTHTIGFVMIVLFSWVLALNAALDLKKASLPLRTLTVLWLLLVTYIAIRVLPPEFTFDRRWADR